MVYNRTKFKKESQRLYGDWLMNQISLIEEDCKGDLERGIVPDLGDEKGWNRLINANNIEIRFAIEGFFSNQGRIIQ